MLTCSAKRSARSILISAAIAIRVCGLAVQTATIRMMFAMARDNNLPARLALARVSPETKTPVVPALVIGVLAVAILWSTSASRRSSRS